jgi:hypothetical protein
MPERRRVTDFSSNNPKKLKLDERAQNLVLKIMLLQIQVEYAIKDKRKLNSSI